MQTINALMKKDYIEEFPQVYAISKHQPFSQWLAVYHIGYIGKDILTWIAIKSIWNYFSTAHVSLGITNHMQMAIIKEKNSGHVSASFSCSLPT